MYLKILSLKGIEYEGDITSLNIKTQSGEITILDNHRPLITILKGGRAVITNQENRRQEVEIRGGFLEVAPKNKVSVLVD